MPPKSPSPLNLLIRALILFVAMFALLIGYYWVHKPFDFTVFGRVGNALLDLLTVAALFSIAGGFGRAALTRLDLSLLSRTERVALECGIGLGLTALAALICGLFGFFRPPLIWGALILITILLRKSLIGWLVDAREVLRSALRIESLGQGLMALYCVLMLAMGLLIALAPQTHWDSLTYHLIAPQRYIQTAAITAQPDNFYLGLSQNVEMLYGLTVGLFGHDTAAAPVHFGLGVLALLATAGVVRRFAGRTAGWTAALLLLSSYNLWALLGWAYVDLGSLLYGALALISATLWRETARLRGIETQGGRETKRQNRQGIGFLILMGVIVGLAVGVKYTAGALGVALGVFVLIHEPRRVIQNGAIMLIAAVLAFAPWAAKGLLLYGNPIYPFVFGGFNWNAERTAAFNFADYNLIARGDGWQLPLLPIAATVFGRDNVDGFGFTLGPWLMTLFLLLPLVWAFLDSRAKRLALDAVTLIAPLMIFWAVMAAANSVGIQTRLMVMALPVFAAAGAVALHGLSQFPEKPLDIKFIVRMVLALTLVLTLLDALRETVREQVAPYLTAQIELGDYMYTNTGAHYNALSSLPEGSRVRLMWEPRSYYCPPTVTCTADVLFDNWKRPMIDEGLTPDQVFERYRADGDDYLLLFHSLYEQYLAYSRNPQLDEQFPTVLDRWMTPVWTDGLRYTLYGWK